MVKIIIFGIIAVLIFLRFRGELRAPSRHGFYMFFAFEAILVLFYFNFRWEEAVTWQRILPGIFLTLSALIAISGFYGLKRHGNPGKDWEDTTRLIQEGIFRHIRHPLYTSLMLLSLGILLNHWSIAAMATCAVALLFLLAASMAEERENLNKFGDGYRRYRKITKRYLPFLI